MAEQADEAFGLDPKTFATITAFQEEMSKSVVHEAKALRSMIAQAAATAAEMHSIIKPVLENLPRSLPQMERLEWPSGAIEIMDHVKALRAKTDPGSKLLAKWVGSLSLPEALSVRPLLMPVKRARGRPKGSKRATEYHNVALAFWSRNGRAPSKREIANEIKATTARNSAVDNIARDLRRHPSRTKNTAEFLSSPED